MDDDDDGPSSDLDALLKECEAAELLRLSVRTLQAWRVQGRGPRYVQPGRVIRYRRRDLIAWVEANSIWPKKPSEDDE